MPIARAAATTEYIPDIVVSKTMVKSGPEFIVQEIMIGLSNIQNVESKSSWKR